MKPKKNYIYLVVLIIATIVLTLTFSIIYKNEVIKTCYLYENLNKITTLELDEYIMENPDSIIYIGDKNDLSNNKFEKKLLKQLKKHNLLENSVYIEKNEVTKEFKNSLKNEHSQVYDESKLPMILIVIDGGIEKIIDVSNDSSADTIIEYEVFK